MFRDVADDAQIANLLFAAMTAAQLDVQERSKHRGRSKDYQELAAARLTKFDYGVQISGFPEGTEWDVVATRWSSGLLRYQYDPKKNVWKPMLSSFIKPIMEDWWKSKTKLFFGLKLLKMWNSHLPPLRCKSQTGQMVSPLSSFHLVLLCMAAAPDWQSEMTLQDTCHLAALWLRLFHQVCSCFTLCSRIG